MRAPRLNYVLLFQRGELLHRHVYYFTQIEAERPADEHTEDEKRTVIAAANPCDNALFLFPFDFHNISLLAALAYQTAVCRLERL